MILLVDNRLQKDSQTTKFSLTSKLIQFLGTMGTIVSSGVSIIPWDKIQCIIFSGSGLRLSMTHDHPKIKHALSILSCSTKYGIPCLGICFGFQLMAYALGYTITARKTGENPYVSKSVFTASTMYFNHNDCVMEQVHPVKLDKVEYHNGYLINFQYRNWTGVQWHPENTTEGIVWLRGWILSQFDTHDSGESGKNHRDVESTVTATLR